MVPARELHHGGLARLVNQRLGRFGGRHLVHLAQHKKHRTRDRLHGFFAVGVAVTGLEIAVENVGLGVAGDHPPAQCQGGAVNPGACAQNRGWRRQGRPGQVVNQFQGLEGFVLRGLQQRRRDFHGESRAHQHQLADAFRRAAGRFQRNQRAVAVAHQNGLLQPGGVHQGQYKVGGFFHRGGRRASAAAMAGQVQRQHVEAVVGQVAALQNPDTVVVQGAVDEDDAGFGGIKRLAAGVAVGAVAVDGVVHWAFSATFSARLRSSSKSPASSRPMDKRMVPWVIPPAAKASSLMRKWVVLAG